MLRVSDKKVYIRIGNKLWNSINSFFFNACDPQIYMYIYIMCGKKDGHVYDLKGLNFLPNQYWSYVSSFENDSGIRIYF